MKKIRVTFTIDENIREKLQRHCKENNIIMSGLVNKLINNHLTNNN